MTRLNANTANIQQLSQYQQQMHDNDYIEGNAAKRMYSKRGPGGNVKISSWKCFKRSRFGDGKKAVRNVITKYVGSRASKQIMNGALANGSYQNNRIPMAKHSLGSALSQAKKEKLQQMNNAYTPSQRGRILEQFSSSSPLEAWNNPEIRPLIQLQAEAELSTENFAFMELCAKYDRQLEEYDQLASQQPVDQNALAAKLQDIRSTANEIKGPILDNDSGVNVALNSRIRRQLERIDTMGIDGLKELVSGTPRKAVFKGAFKAAKANANDTIPATDQQHYAETELNRPRSAQGPPRQDGQRRPSSGHGKHDLHQKQPFVRHQQQVEPRQDTLLGWEAGRQIQQCQANRAKAGGRYPRRRQGG